MAAISLFWDTNMTAVTSCENTLLHYCDLLACMHFPVLGDSNMYYFEFWLVHWAVYICYEFGH